MTDASPISAILAGFELLSDLGHFLQLICIYQNIGARPDDIFTNLRTSASYEICDRYDNRYPSVIPYCDGARHFRRDLEDDL